MTTKILFITLLLQTINTHLIAQTAEISGVISSQGTSMESVNVMLQYTPYGNITDSNGKFNIVNVPYGNYTLLISLVGYKSVKKIIKVDQPIVNVSTELQEETNTLDEIVVTGVSH